jgi:diguanylate cyclase (GGDEF)-like protein/PAS domain S-box-containing protein
MSNQLLRLPTSLTAAEIYRIASFCLYTAVLAHANLVAPALWLPYENPGFIGFLLLAFLALFSLTRLAMRPQWLPVHQRCAIVESMAALSAMSAFSYANLFPLPPLPWLIGIAATFPLVLSSAATWLGLSLLSAILLAIGILNGTPVASGMEAAAIVLAGSISLALAKTSAMHQEAIRQAYTNERRFNAIARATRHVFMIADTNFQIKYVNPALYDVVGYTQEEIETDNLRPIVHPDDLEMHQRKLRFLRDKPGSKIFSSHRMQHKDGHWIWLETRGYNMLHDAAINGLVFSVEDITARKEAEHKLQKEHALLRAVLDHNPSMIYAKDIEGHFTISNSSFQRQMGYSSEEELQGKTVHTLLSNPALASQPKSFDQIEDLHRQDMQIVQQGLPLRELESQGFLDKNEKRWYLTNKYPLRDAYDRVYGMLGITQDITERKEYELRLEHQALHDSLTALPNRRYLLKKISDQIACFDTKEPIVLLFCDLDFFKSVNDTHGHDIGDKCLIEITKRIKAALPETDFICRYGGDEFVVLSHTSLQKASDKAQVLIQNLSLPLIVDDVIVKIQASIGIAQLRTEHKTPSDPIHDADAAMYQAKENGRNRAEIFSPSLQYKVARRAQLDVALRFALERNELSICYQPKVSLQDRSITGFELLLRWNSHQHGEIAPGEFIPISEDSGLIIPIGLWALEQACWQLHRWQNERLGRERLTIAVNVSMRQLLLPSFIPDIQRIIARTGIAPHLLELEVTETSAMANPMQTIENLSMLKKLGVKLALDDFGTGYSSLAYLQKLPIDILKIDRAFVMGLGKDKNDDAIVRLILALTRSLGLETVAEGVESEQHIQLLKSLGCYLGQGHYFSHPIPPHEAEELLSNSLQIPLQT